MSDKEFPRYDYEPLAERSDKDLEKSVEHFYSLVENHAPEMYKKLLAGTCEILDIGAGKGQFVDELVRQGHSVVGLEANKYGMSADASSHRVLGDAHEILFSDGSFDIVTNEGLTDPIAYPQNDFAKIFNEIHRVLKPGGIFIDLLFRFREHIADPIDFVYQPQAVKKFKELFVEIGQGIYLKK